MATYFLFISVSSLVCILISPGAMAPQRAQNFFSLISLNSHQLFSVFKRIIISMIVTLSFMVCFLLVDHSIYFLYKITITVKKVQFLYNLFNFQNNDYDYISGLILVKN
jgi:hypothetical protein